MKTTLLACFMLMSSFASAFEGAGSSGGGDPLIIMSSPYPETKQLDEAIELSIEKILKAQLPSALKEKLENEVLTLRQQSKFQLLPAIIILGPNGGPESYPLPDDAYKFVSLGGMTRFESGAPIFLSERVRSYSSTKLMELVLHETLHHVLSSHLTKDEGFVEELTESIIASHVPGKLHKALKHGAYFRKGYISRDGLFDHPLIKDLMMKNLAGYDPNMYIGARLLAERMKMVKSFFHSNMDGATLFNLYWALANTMGPTGLIPARIEKTLTQLVHEINPGISTGGKISNFGCRVKVSFWTGKCPMDQQVPLNEVLNME